MFPEPSLSFRNLPEPLSLFRLLSLPLDLISLSIPFGAFGGFLKQVIFRGEMNRWKESGVATVTFLPPGGWSGARLPQHTATAFLLAGTRVFGRARLLVVGRQLFQAALLAQLGIAPSLRVAHVQMHPLDVGRRKVGCRIGRLGAHAQRDEAQFAQTHRLAVEHQLLQTGEHIHQYTVDYTP